MQRMKHNDLRLATALWCVAALALLLAAGAMAASVSVNWTNPTQRTDGTPLAANEIARTEVQWGTCPSFSTVGGAQSAMGSMTGMVIDNLKAGTWCFRARTYAITPAEPSGWSLVVSKTIDALPPNPPTLLTVSVVAYELQKKGVNSKMVDVGRVALGVQCYGEPVMPGHYMIPPDAVKTTKKYQGGVLWGKCA